MKLKKQQMIIIGVIIIALILVVSVAVIMMSNNDGSTSNNNDDSNTPSDNGDGTNGGGDGNGGSSQFSGSWMDISSRINGNHHYLDVYAINDKVWILAEGSHMFISKDDGNSFTNISLGTNYAQCIFMRSETEGYIGTTGGRILRTTDGGNTWNALGGTLLNTIYSISFPPTGDIGYCCGNNGWVGKVNSTKLYGTEKIVVTTFWDICFPDTTDEGWVCGSFNVFLHYIDGNWEPSIYAGGGSLKSIFVLPNTREGWVVGEYGHIIHFSCDATGPTDGDIQMPDDENNIHLEDVFFINNLEGWAVGEVGLILHTTDGGKNWVEERGKINKDDIAEDAPTDEWLLEAFFTSPTNGYVVGLYDTLLKYIGEE